jgi:hypothetical protein
MYRGEYLDSVLHSVHLSAPSYRNRIYGYECAKSSNRADWKSRVELTVAGNSSGSSKSIFCRGRVESQPLQASFPIFKKLR